MSNVRIAGYSIYPELPNIILPVENQMAKIAKILLDNRLLRLENEKDWTMYVQRRFRFQRPILNKILHTIDFLFSQLPPFCLFYHDPVAYCYECDTELNVVSIIVNKTTQGRTTIHEKSEYYPNLVAYCPECDFVIKLEENVWADNQDGDEI